MPKFEWDEFIEVSKKRFPKIMNNAPFLKWLETKRELGRLFDMRLYRVCYGIHRRITNTNRPLDNWIAITGVVGSGKSTLAIKVSSVVSANFEMQDIIFDYEGLRQGIKRSSSTEENGHSLSIDEAVSMLFSREAMKQGTIVVVKTSMLMRLFRINVVLCIPEFYSLDTKIREERINCLLYIYHVGKYIGITKKGIDWLVNHKEKYRTLRKAVHFIPNEFVWYGDFNRTYPKQIPEKDYVDHKRKYAEEGIDEMFDKLSPKKAVSKSELARKMVSLNEAAEISGLSKRTLWTYGKEKKIRMVFYGNKNMVDLESLNNLINA